MGHCCVVPNCKAYSKKSTNRTFHSFPKDPERRKQWELAIKRTNFTASEHSKVCSKHFTPESFDTARFGGTWLKPDALPTLFEPDEPRKKKPQKPRKARTPKKIPTTRTESPVSTPTTQGESPVPTPTTQGDSPVLSPTTKGESPVASPNSKGESPKKQGESPVPRPPKKPGESPTSPATKKRKPDVESWNKALLELHRNPPTIPGESPDDSWNKALLKLHKKTLTDRGLSPDESLNEVSCAAVEEMHRKRLWYFGDYDEEDMKSPEKALKFLEIAKEEVAKTKKLVRKLKRDNNILHARNASLKEKMAELKKLKTPQQHTEPSSNGLFIDRLLNPHSKDQYPKELKALSLNLYSYSPTAYIHVRRNFQYKLPHPGTVRKWIRDIHNHETGSDNCDCEACKVEAAEECKADTEVCDCDECNAEDCEAEECDTEECNAEECDTEDGNAEECDTEDCNAEECDTEDCNAEEDCDTEDYNVDSSNAEDRSAAAYIAEVCYTEVCNTEDCTSDRCYTEL